MVTDNNLQGNESKECRNSYKKGHSSRKKKSTKNQLAQKLLKVRELQNQGKTLQQISDIMKINLRTVEYYSNKINEQDRAKWDKMETESLESRALQIKRKYEDLAAQCEVIMNDPHKSPKDRIDAGKTMIACHNNIFNMLKDGPLRVNTVIGNNKILEDKSEEN